MISKELLEVFKHIGIEEDRIDDCTVRDASLAYRRIAKTCHPDRCGPDATEAEITDATAAFQALGNAYEAVITFLVDKLKGSKQLSLV